MKSKKVFPGFIIKLSLFAITLIFSDQLVFAQKSIGSNENSRITTVPSIDQNSIQNLPVFRGDSDNTNNNPSMQDQSENNNIDQSSTTSVKRAVKSKATIDESTLYTWTDEQGVTHVTNTPPPDITIDVQKREPTKLKFTTTSSPSGTLSAVDRLKQLEKSLADKQEAEKKEKEEKARKALYCDQLQRRISLYKSDNKINIIGDDGNPQEVDSKSRANTLNTIQDSYAATCQ